MPGEQHVKGASPKQNRAYTHIKENLMKHGKSEEEAKRIAAATSNKMKSEGKV